MYYYGYRRRKRKRPGLKKVKNGIKVRAKRGDLGQGWLAKAWIRALEDASHMSNSFTRGRTYARKGQVLSVEVKKGSVVAMVQGRERLPYEMRMTVDVPGETYWKTFAHMLQEKPAYAAAILAGEMPEEMDDEMASRGLALFPTRSELSISCRCSDWSHLCKHATSASYILAEEFDRNPLLYLNIRGINRDDFLSMLEPDAPDEPPALSPPALSPPALSPPALSPPAVTDSDDLRSKELLRDIFGLGRRPPKPARPSSPAFPHPAVTAKVVERKIRAVKDKIRAVKAKESALPEPSLVFGGLAPGFDLPDIPAVPDERTQIPSDPREFWGRSSHVSDSYDSALAPAEPAALAKMLGRFPMWRGESQFVTLLEEIYRQASLTGANAYMGIRAGLGKGARGGAQKK